MYKIVVVGGPAEDYIDRCLESLLAQEIKDWEACVVLDPVGDLTYERAKKFESSKIKVIKNDEKMFALPNILRSIKELNPDDEDVIITVDADDWLEGTKALSVVDTYYKRNPELLVTHGSWQQYPNPGEITNNGAYNEVEFRNGIRRYPFRASHLRTFKYKLWKRIKEEDLKDGDGDFYTSAWDLSFMWPLLEMAGVRRVKFIPEVLYNYNQETPYNDAKVRLEEQCRLTDYIARLQPYKYVEEF